MTMTTADMPPAGAGVPHRREFSNEYKLRIVAEYDAATARGARGALLRREGLFDSHIGKWRKARDAGRLTGATAARPSEGGLARENARLRAQVEALSGELESTKAVLDIVGKAHGLLRMVCEQPDSTRSSRTS